MFLCVAAAVASFIGYTVGVNRSEPPDLRTFTSYDDCTQNGGMHWNAEFNACSGDAQVVDGVEQGELFLQYSAQNLPRLTERKRAEKDNVVESVGSPSSDLLAFLKNDDTGCSESGYYKVLKEVPARFALANFGCTEAGDAKDDAHVVAIKLADGWSLISPTNHFNEDGVPSCLMVDMFRIPKTLSGKCFENTGYNDGQLRDVSYL